MLRARGIRKCEFLTVKMGAFPGDKSLVYNYLQVTQRRIGRAGALHVTALVSNSAAAGTVSFQAHNDSFLLPPPDRADGDTIYVEGLSGQKLEGGNP